MGPSHWRLHPSTRGGRRRSRYNRCRRPSPLGTPRGSGIPRGSRRVPPPDSDRGTGRRARSRWTRWCGLRVPLSQGTDGPVRLGDLGDPNLWVDVGDGPRPYGVSGAPRRNRNLALRAGRIVRAVFRRLASGQRGHATCDVTVASIAFGLSGYSPRELRVRERTGQLVTTQFLAQFGCSRVRGTKRNCKLKHCSIST